MKISIWEALISDQNCWNEPWARSTTMMLDFWRKSTYFYKESAVLLMVYIELTSEVYFGIAISNLLLLMVVWSSNLIFIPEALSKTSISFTTIPMESCLPILVETSSGLSKFSYRSISLSVWLATNHVIPSALKPRRFLLESASYSLKYSAYSLSPEP